MIQDQHIQIAITAALQGGAAILDVYNNAETKVEYKDDKSPLTQADGAAHRAIVKLLEPTGIPILSEEGKSIPTETRCSWSQLWIVDPLDGTKEFIKRNGEFTVNIALVEEGKPVAGVIYVPVLEELYVGTVGEGAYKLKAAPDVLASALDWGSAQKLPVTHDIPFTAVGSRSHMNEDTAQFLERYKAAHGEVAILSRGSSLKICMVAEGKAHVYPRFAPTMEWDTAAGQAIAESAGFEMVHPKTGASLQYNKEDLLNPHFIVRKPE